MTSSKNITIETDSKIGCFVMLLLLALVIYCIWWFWSSLFSITLGTLLLYLAIGIVGFAIGRFTSN